MKQRPSLHQQLVIFHLVITLTFLNGVNMDTLTSDHTNFAETLTNAGKFIETPLQIQHESKRTNYASSECAKVLETNPEAKKPSHIINEMIDEYMLNPCKTKIWFVLELCDVIKAKNIEIANYELFSSTPKDFTVYFSDKYPALDWKLIGQFTATDSRTLQSFDLMQVGFGKFIRVELHSHYGNEHYCPISVVKVYGTSMVDDFEDDLKKSADSNPDNNHKSNVTNQMKNHRTSAFRIYRSMMTDPNICGLSQSIDENDREARYPTIETKIPASVILPQPTQQPLTNRTSLKQSIFVEMSNKVKNLETFTLGLKNSTKSELEEIRKELLNLKARFEKFSTRSQVGNALTLIVIAYLVYKLMLDLM